MAVVPADSPILWLVLAGLAYVLVTCVLWVLAAQRKHALDLHDTVRQSKVLRRQYLEAVHRTHGTAK